MVVDRYVSAILQTRADDDGYTRRAHYENDQRIITQLNSDNTELIIAYPRFYKGCYYTECIDPNDVSKARRFGAACFWAFRPTLRISSIFTEFVPDENGDSWSYPASGGRIRGFYRKKPVVEGGSIPWSDPTRYRIRVDSACWPAGTVFWDPSREAEPEDPPERWPNVFTWTVED